MYEYRKRKTYVIINTWFCFDGKWIEIRYNRSKNIKINRYIITRRFIKSLL